MMQRHLISRGLRNCQTLIQLGERTHRRVFQNKALIVTSATAVASATTLTWCENRTPEATEELVPDLKNDDKQTKITGDLEQESIEKTSKADDDDDDEDEPTSCTICLINRQGPCRPKWRKFERCMKKNSSEEDGEGVGDKCDDIMIPWLTCVQSYRNTYTLITNKFYQNDFVDELEDNISDQDKKIQESLNGTQRFINFENYEKYCLESSSSDDGESKSNEKETNNQNGTDDNVDDPLLVQVSATINLMDDTREISLAYVRDQDGNVLGFEQFSSYKKLRKEKLESSETQKQDEKSDVPNTDDDDAITTTDNEKNTEENVELPTVGDCNFSIQPGKTKSVRVFAYYKEIPRMDSNTTPNTGDSQSESNIKNTSPKENDEKSEDAESDHVLYVSASVPLPTPLRNKKIVTSSTKV